MQKFGASGMKVQDSAVEVTFRRLEKGTGERAAREHTVKGFGPAGRVHVRYHT
jgi:hypothetical protein